MNDTNLSSLFAQAKRYPLLSKDEEKELGLKAVAGDTDAQDKLVKHNLRLVFKLANPYFFQEASADDLIQEGVIGLVRASRTFNPGKGAGFAHYASWWINDRIWKCLADHHSVVKVGKATRQAQRIKREAPPRMHNLRWFTQTIAAGTVPPRPKDRPIGSDMSLNTPAPGLFKEPDMEFIDLIPTKGGVEEVVETDHRNYLRSCIDSALACLTSREQKVITERFLLEEPRVLVEIGKDLGVSRERVRQIQKVALEKITPRLRPLEKYLQDCS